MSNYIDELIVGIRVNAQGVKNGVEQAKGFLAGYQKELAKMQEDIKLKLEKSGLNKIHTDINELKKKKEQLSGDLNFKLKVESGGIDKLKKDAKSINSEIIKLKASVDDSEAQTKITNLKEQKKDIEKEIKAKIGVNLENQDKAKKELQGIETQIKKLENKVKIELETSGINKATNEMQKLEAKAEETRVANESLSQSMVGLGITATAVFAGIVVSVNKGIEAYNQYTNAMTGLRSQMDYVGEDMGKATQAMKDLTSDGLISESDVAKSIKNLTLYGYSLEDSIKIIDRLKDSASYNRQAHYSLGEAVRVTTEGIRMENSILSDAAGVTKNIAKMKEEYAQSVGKSAQALTQEEKALAVNIGIMAETEPMLGNAIKYSEQLGGAMAENTQRTVKLSEAYGSALAPTVELYNDAMITAKEVTTQVIKENEGLVAGLTTSIGSFTGLTVAGLAIGKVILIVRNLTTALKDAMLSAKGVSLSFGAITGWLAGISALVGVITMIITEVKKAKEAQEELNAEVEKFNELMAQATTTENVGQKEAELKKIKEVLELTEKIKQFYQEALPNEYSSSTTGISFEKSGFSKVLEEEFKDAKVTMLDFEKALKVCGYSIEHLFTATGQMKPMEDLKIIISDIKDEIGGLGEDVENFTKITDFNIGFDNLNETITAVENLNNSFNKLNSGQALTSTELSKLIAQYPVLAQYIATTGDVTLNNGNAIMDLMREEIDLNIKAMETQKQKIELEIESVQKAIEIKQELLKSQTGDDAKNTRIEIDNLTQALEDYSIQTERATANINVLNNEMNSLDTQNLLSGFRSAQSEIDKLNSAYTKLAQGQKLTFDETQNLISSEPQLLNYLADTGDATFKNGKLIDDVLKNNIKVQDAKRESLIANSKAELLVVQNEVTEMAKLYEQEKQSLIGLMRAREIAYNNNITMQYDTIGPRTQGEIMDKQYTEIQAKLKEKQGNLEKQIKEIEAINIVAKNASANIVDNVGSSGGSSGAIKDQNTELEKQLTLFEKLKQTSEISTKDQLKHLTNLKNQYAKTNEDFEKINAMIYSVRKSTNDDWYTEEIETIKKLNKGRTDNTDFAEMIEKYKQLINEMKIAYKEYPETVKQLESELNSHILEATKQRLTKVSQMEKDSLNAKVEAVNEHITLLKKLDGLTFGGATIKFTGEDEASLIKNNLDSITNALESFRNEKGVIIKNMTNDEKAYYEDLLSMQKEYSNKYIDSLINIEKEKQKIIETSLKEQQKQAENASKEQIQAIKNKYKTEIDELKNANSEIIALYEERIKEIDDILKQDQIDERDNDLLDQIRRTEEQLKYETDESNKYALKQEIERLKAEYEKNKKEDALKDEKDKLQEEINNLKDGNSEKIKELEKLRDEEIANIEKSIENYTKMLEEKLKKEIETNTQATANLSEELIKRLKEQDKINTKKENNLTQSMINEKNIVEKHTNGIISMLQDKLSTFASIGDSWGQAIADNFNAKVSGITGSVSSYSLEGNGRSMGSVNNYNTFTQTITTPVANPSKVRRETERMLKNTRYF